MQKIPGFRTPSIRVRMDNPDHHIWDNNGTWFIHYTLYPSAYSKKRIRRSLRTKDIACAQLRQPANHGPNLRIAPGQHAQPMALGQGQMHRNRHHPKAQQTPKPPRGVIHPKIKKGAKWPLFTNLRLSVTSPPP